MEGITDSMVLTILGVAGAIFLFIVFVTYIILFTAPACWRPTLNDIDRITGETMIEKLLGKEDFFAPISLAASCGDSVILGAGRTKCISECREYGADQEKCAKECQKCRDDFNSCILATPVKRSRWNLLNPTPGYIERLRLAFQDLFQAYNTNYQFEGDTRVTAPEDGKEDFCLHFTKASQTYNIYNIKYEKDISRESCT